MLLHKAIFFIPKDIRENDDRTDKWSHGEMNFNMIAIHTVSKMLYHSIVNIHSVNVFHRGNGRRNDDRRNGWKNDDGKNLAPMHAC